MKRAVITGVTGFIGSHLANHLLSEGWDVHGLTRETSKAPAALSPDVQLRVVPMELESIRDTLSELKPDVVFHLATYFIAEHKPNQVNALFQANIEFGLLLVEAMKEAKVTRLINTGTAWQHFQDEPYNPVCLYAAMKEAFSNLLRFYAEAGAVRAITLTLCDTYGANDPRRKILQLLFQALCKDGEMKEPLGLSPGDQQIDLVHVSDVVTAFEMAANLLLDDGSIRFAEYAVTSKKPVSLKQLAQHVEEASGRTLAARWGVRPYRHREVMQSWKGGEWLPGWNPKVSLSEGLRQILRPERTLSLSEVEPRQGVPLSLEQPL